MGKADWTYALPDMDVELAVNRTQSFNSLPVLTDLLTFRAPPGCGSLPG